MLVSRDDLEKNGTGDVLLPVLIDDPYIGVIDDPVVNIIEGDVPLDLKVIQPAVGVFLDRSQLAHAISFCAWDGSDSQRKTPWLVPRTPVVLDVSLKRTDPVSQTNLRARTRSYGVLS